MPLWFDNTGLHCVGRVLDRRAQGTLDVDGFLQFASYLVFSDAVHVNAFEQIAVGARTAEVCDALAEFGLPPDALVRCAATRDEFLLACDQAADVCLHWIDLTFRPSEDSSTVVPEMPRREWDLRQLLDEAVRGTRDEEWVTKFEREEGAHPATLASLYMVTRNAALRDATQGVVNSTIWTREDTGRLDTYFRVFLNDMLARQHGAIYAPSVDRARRVRTERKLVVDLVLRQLDRVAAARSLDTTALPALVRLLLQRGHGEPEGIIEAALEQREKTQVLRAWVGQLAAKLDLDPEQGFAEVCKKVEELGRDTFRAMRLVLPTGSPVSAELSVWGAANPPVEPVLAIPLRGLQWAWGGRGRRRALVLSELADAAAFVAEGDAYYEKLVRISQASRGT